MCPTSPIEDKHGQVAGVPVRTISCGKTIAPLSHISNDWYQLWVFETLVCSNKAISWTPAMDQAYFVRWYFAAFSVRCRIISNKSSLLKLLHFNMSFRCLSLASLIFLAAARSFFLISSRAFCNAEISFLFLEVVVANGAIAAKLSLLALAFSAFFSLAFFFHVYPQLHRRLYDPHPRAELGRPGWTMIHHRLAAHPRRLSSDLAEPRYLKPLRILCSYVGQ